MTVILDTGTFAANTSTGNQTVTLSDFGGATPKAVIIFSSNRSGDAQSFDSNMAIGGATSSSNRAAVSIFDKNSSASSDAQGAHSNADVVYLTEAGSIKWEADFVSFAADNFTINWQTVQGSAVDFRYIAIGGSSITNVKVHEFTSPASTGNNGVTGVGFQPDGIPLFFSVGHTAAPPATTNDFNLALGGFATNGDGGGVTASCQHNQMNNNKRFRGWANNGICTVNNTAATEMLGATHVSWDSDGYTLNWSNVSNGVLLWGLCIKGRDVAIDAFTIPTSISNPQLINSGIDLAAGALVFCTGQTDASRTYVDFNVMATGAGDSSTRISHSFRADHDDPSDTLRQQGSNSLIVNDHATATVESRANLNDPDGTSFSLSWIAVSGNADNCVVIGIQKEGAPVTAKPMFHPF